MKPSNEEDIRGYVPLDLENCTFPHVSERVFAGLQIALALAVILFVTLVF